MSDGYFDLKIDFMRIADVETKPIDEQRARKNREEGDEAFRLMVKDNSKYGEGCRISVLYCDGRKDDVWRRSYQARPGRGNTSRSSRGSAVSPGV